MSTPQRSSRRLRPRPAALVFAGLVAAVSVGLAVFGLQDLLLSHQPLGLIVAVVGAYGLAQVVRTPLGLELDEAGVLRLRALVGGGAAPAKEVVRVELTRTSTLRPDVYAFLRSDGSAAFTSDAGLWDVKGLRDLLQAAGVKLAASPPPGRARRGRGGR